MEKANEPEESHEEGATTPTYKFPERSASPFSKTDANTLSKSFEFQKQNES